MADLCSPKVISKQVSHSLLLPATQLQPDQSIQHPMKLSTASYSQLPNLMGGFPSVTFLFPECQSFSPFTTPVCTGSYLIFQEQLKDHFPLEAFLHCSPPSRGQPPPAELLKPFQPVPSWGAEDILTNIAIGLNLSK